MKWLVAAGSILVACTANHDKLDTKPAEIGGFLYDAPVGWQHVDTKLSRSLTSTWTPSDEENDRKESLVVIRSKIDPSLAIGGAAQVENLLVTAQGELPQLHLQGAPIRSTTEQGMTALRLEADFVPLGVTATYHRTHVALLDGDTLLHVIYTAKDPDPDGLALNAAMQSLRHGGG